MAQRARSARTRLRRKTTTNPWSVAAHAAKERNLRGDKAALVNKTFHGGEETDRCHSPKQVLKDWDNGALEALWAQERRERIQGMIDVKLELQCASELSAADLEACFRIIEHTSRDDYKSSSIGWDAVTKAKEMYDPNMMYLLIRAAPGTDETFAPGLTSDIIGFASFMLTQDDAPHQHRTVAYIYEVHIGEKFRGKGIGKFLVFTIEAMADMAGLTKVMLTVFKSNVGAIEAYKKLGYVKDVASPPDRETRTRVVEADYMIMSKMWPMPSLGEWVTQGSKGHRYGC